MACTSPVPGPVAGESPYVDPFVREEGGRLYSHYCSPCHGERGGGDGIYFATELHPRPANFREPGFPATRTEADLFRAIRGGSASVGRSNLCPPWGFTLKPEEINYLVLHIRSLAGKGPGNAAGRAGPAGGSED